MVKLKIIRENQEQEATGKITNELVIDSQCDWCGKPITKIPSFCEDACKEAFIASK